MCDIICHLSAHVVHSGLWRLTLSARTSRESSVSFNIVNINIVKTTKNNTKKISSGLWRLTLSAWTSRESSVCIITLSISWEVKTVKNKTTKKFKKSTGLWGLTLWLSNQKNRGEMCLCYNSFFIIKGKKQERKTPGCVDILENIVRGTTDPGYWLRILRYLYRL